MKINWNFLGGEEGGAKQKTFRGGSMDIIFVKVHNHHQQLNCTLPSITIEKHNLSSFH